MARTPQYSRRLPLSRSRRMITRPGEADINRVILDAQSRFIRFDHQAPAFEGVLMELLSLTSSEMGWIGEFAPEGNGDDALIIRSVSCLEWTDGLLSWMAQMMPRDRTFRSLQGDLGEAICSNRSSVYGPQHPFPVPAGLPDGTPDVHHALILPLTDGDRRLGVILLFNRPKGYCRAWVKALEPLQVSLGQMLATRQLKEAHSRDQQELERLSLVARHTTNGVVMTNPAGEVEWVNEAFERMTGYRFEQLRGRKPGDLLQGPDSSRETAARIASCLKAGRGFEEEILNYRQDGTRYWAAISCTPVRAQEHGMNGYIAIQSDISDRKRTENELRIAASVYRNTREAVMITNADNIIIDVNPAFTAITGYDATQVIGEDPSMLASALHDSDFYDRMWTAIAQSGHWRGEIWNRRRNGEIYPELLSISAVCDNEGKVTHHVAVFSDISQLKNHEKELEAAANFDVLTGLPNRRLLADRMNNAIARADRAEQPLAVCLLDMDGFKPINDTYGHDLGDRVLQEMARRLTGSLRGDDTVARLGGDEFVLLLHGHTPASTFERLLQQLSEPMEFDQVRLRPTVSLGITLYPDDKSDSDLLLRHADQAMYQAKEAGKNRFSFFDPHHDAERMHRRESLIRLNTALKQGEFRLFFQPQIDMYSGAILGFEALIRWQHPDKGVLSPGAFLPHLEGSDLERPLGEWVIRQALQEMAGWHDAGKQFAVSINVSPNHLLDRRFMGFLAEAVKRHPGVRPPMISLEVLESTALHDMREAWRAIDECRSLGFQVALDDFGTGFSSLTYLRTLPVDLIKIDQSFIRGMLENKQDRSIVESVIFLAEKFERPVLAEGVETPEHACALISMGCRWAQGYGIARPMPAEEVLAWSRDWQQENPYRRQNGQN